MSCQGMGVEKVCIDDTARTFEFLFRFNRVWINSRLLLLIFIISKVRHSDSVTKPDYYYYYYYIAILK